MSGPERRRGRDSRARVSVAVAVAVVVAVSALWGAGAASDGPVPRPGGSAVVAAQHQSSTTGPDDDAAPGPDTLRELLAAMTGSATADPLDLAPGSLLVDREGEDDLTLSWALLDTDDDGRWTGSADAATTRFEAESTIKAWLAADTLRAAAQAGRPVTADQRADISAAVRASDDDAAERLYRALGRDASTARLDEECGVEVSTSRPG